jgi:hypothetical protein
MKITVEITDAGNEMVQFEFSHSPQTDDDTLAVLRAVSRMSRALSEEYSNIHGESEFLKKEFLGEPEPPGSE